MNLVEKFNLKFFKSINLDKPIDLAAFESSIRVYINKPQVVNKWVAGSITLDSLPELDQNLVYDSIDYKEFITKNNKIFTNLKYLILFSKNQVLFQPINASNELKYPAINLIHLFELDDNKLNLYAESLDEKQLQWLVDTLMIKLIQWSQNIKSDEYATCAKLNTLTLYDNMVNDYVKLYQQLKEIYWSQFEPNWFEITSTNPEKFIHEDIAIATYFILVWKHLNVKVKQFVDLGCGNGLLVYILNDQGYNGYGIDMRRRRIWSNEYYNKLSVRLEEKTINPQVDTFDECDWLIGNHSDELSPWMGIIAQKTSKKSQTNCSFLLIPCCFFDFYSKYDVKKKNESRYDTYLNYLEQIFQCLNFKLIKDKLRIPSTRNICFIAQMSSESLELNSINLGLKEKIDQILTGSYEFKARDLDLENKKSSRNCTKNISFDLKVFIIRKILNKLLEVENYVSKYDGTEWNSGQVVSLNSIASLFDKETLTKLKQECGGIKTLIKNNHQLFETFNNDQVKIRIKQAELNEKKYFKTKQCLFELYHPNGCLLNHLDCFFIHKNKS